MTSTTPRHMQKRCRCVCRNCGQEFYASRPDAGWCDTNLCQRARTVYYREKVRKKK